MCLLLHSECLIHYGVELKLTSPYTNIHCGIKGLSVVQKTSHETHTLPVQCSSAIYCILHPRILPFHFHNGHEKLDNKHNLITSGLPAGYFWGYFAVSGCAVPWQAGFDFAAAWAVCGKRLCSLRRMTGYDSQVDCLVYDSWALFMWALEVESVYRQDILDESKPSMRAASPCPLVALTRVKHWQCWLRNSNFQR